MNIKIGIVENNVDTMKLGRCQVRIFGLHTENRTEYPTADLPWSVFLTNSSNVSGEGNFFIPNNGDFVAITFLDPEEQKPLILGVIPKFVETLPDFTSGFSDPNSINPKSDYTDESGISRLARNENISDTIIQDKKDDRTTGVQCNGVSWNEPETPYDAEYPHNKVIHTKYHVIELDDTASKERVHIYHKSGTSKEIHPNGDEVDLIKSKRYVVVDSDNNILVKGNYNMRVETNINKEVVGNENKKIGGNKVDTILGNATEDITGNKTIDTDGSTTIDGGTTVDINSGSKMTVDAGADLDIDANDDIDMDGVNITITGSGNIILNGTSIALDGTSSIGGGIGSGKPLATEDIIAIFNNHTHKDVQTGSSSSGTPNTTLSSSEMTSNCKGV